MGETSWEEGSLQGSVGAPDSGPGPGAGRERLREPAGTVRLRSVQGAGCEGVDCSVCDRNKRVTVADADVREGCCSTMAMTMAGDGVSWQRGEGEGYPR